MILYNKLDIVLFDSFDVLIVILWKRFARDSCLYSHEDDNNDQDNDGSAASKRIENKVISTQSN